MSSYEYIDEDGDKLTFTLGKRHLVLSAIGERDAKSIFVSNSDVPTVAAELLKAAGQESVIVPLADLPEVKPALGDPTSFHAGSQSVVFTSAKNARDWVLRDIAVWQFMEARDGRETEAATKLQERRDAIVRDRSGDSKLGYNDVTDVGRRLVDRIIELENEQPA